MTEEIGDAVHPMVRKKKWSKRNTTGSSSSDQQASAKSPSEVFALGHRLARELRAGGERDTLREWLAHHLAELILQADKSEPARDHAVETILKIWAHRRDLPGRAYPLADHKEVLAVLERLGPNADPWRALRQGQRGHELASLFDSFARVVWAGMILTLPSKIIEPDEALAVSMLDEDERRVYEAFHGWREYFDQRASREPQVHVRIVTQEQLEAERQEAEAAQGQPEQSPEEQIRAAVGEMISETQANLIAFRALVDELLSGHRGEERTEQPST